MGKRYNLTTHQRGYPGRKQYMKRILTVLAIMEMQIKTSKLGLATPIRTTSIERETPPNLARVQGNKLFHCTWEQKMVPPLWKTVWLVLLQLKM